MSPVHPLGPLLAEIRARTVERRRKQLGQSTPSEGEAAPGPSEDVLGDVSAAIAAIPRDIPDRRRRAFRLYLQAVLARELGVADANAPEFQELVRQVITSMEQDSTLRDAMERAADLLLAQGP